MPEKSSDKPESLTDLSGFDSGPVHLMNQPLKINAPGGSFSASL